MNTGVGFECATDARHRMTHHWHSSSSDRRVRDVGRGIEAGCFGTNE